jgi:homoserine dehydrogenase
MDHLTLRVGVFGGGVVGGGVCALLDRYHEQLRARHLQIDVVKICVLDLTKNRDFLDATTSTALLTTCYDDILNDPTINCVVELMGGVTDAKDVIMRAIKQNKHVVTANKALVASALEELQQLLSEHPAVQ